ncbi:uncharacterized protein L969DRAFT_105088 [Mixia osmundae IAM 14324]|uniref:Uncharacterized protein n=1 Tax=Mixia osmundae (strain CBS 9802 / IAM 14324 / JCM 22182 / KY 12970) TaxID=764103 RepID=G7DWE5_MIXOS|nr:uncharacterized protein L969DRAFT_105088 [Mixia osmundae IAM 14324]KEI37282.1 hypothetical protein L969DRAFT_105088 [Mixia osmundae IAM 14324]GAA94905.1 hypothetical protein E5Q_01560 [Mixia osmundae IAM 14324]
MLATSSIVFALAALVAGQTVNTSPESNVGAAVEPSAALSLPVGGTFNFVYDSPAALAKVIAATNATAAAASNTTWLASLVFLQLQPSDGSDSTTIFKTDVTPTTNQVNQTVTLPATAGAGNYTLNAYESNLIRTPLSARIPLEITAA